MLYTRSFVSIIIKKNIVSYLHRREYISKVKMCSESEIGQTELEKLPDDCLINIFEFLDGKDFISLLHISSRTRSLAKMAYARKYQYNFRVDGRQSLRHVYLFGDLAKHITVWNEKNLTKNIYSFFAASHNLKSAEFIQLTDFFIGLLPKLKILNINSSCVDFTELLRTHSSLVVLEVGSCDQVFLDLLRLPTLKYLCIRKGAVLDPTLFPKFAMNNTQLLGLKLEVHTTALAMTGFKYLINLEELALQLDLTNGRGWRIEERMQMHNNVFAELAELNNLRALHLKPLTSYTKSLFKLNQIRQLRFGYFLTIYGHWTTAIFISTISSSSELYRISRVLNYQANVSTKKL